MPYSITREDGTADATALQDALNVIKASSSWDSPTAARLRELRDSIEAQVKPMLEEPTGDVVVFVLGRPWWPREGGVHWSTYEHSNNPPTWGELIDEVDRDAVQIYRNEAELVPQSDGAGALPTSPSPEVGVATSPPASSPVEEPTEFGSLIRAVTAGVARILQRPGQARGKHYWENEDGGSWLWSELTDVEVLRIGVGTDEKAKADEAVTYNNGYEKGAADAVTRAIATGNTFRAGWAKGNADTHGRITGELTDLKPTLITAPEKTAIDKAIALIAADLEDTGRGYPS